MVVDAMIRAAAVGGVVTMWSYFTLKIIKIFEQIVFPPGKIYQCEYCSYSSRDRDSLSVRFGKNCHYYVCKNCEEKEDNVCKRCGESFFDDQELEIR